jgi:hypothetical protein
MKEPMYFYIRFRVALFCIGILAVINIMTFYEMNRWVNSARIQMSYGNHMGRMYLSTARDNVRLRRENNMLADIMLSNGQMGVVRFYCDDFRDWQDRQLKNANTN